MVSQSAALVLLCLGAHEITEATTAPSIVGACAQHHAGEGSHDAKALGDSRLVAPRQRHGAVQVATAGEAVVIRVRAVGACCVAPIDTEEVGVAHVRVGQICVGQVAAGEVRAVHVRAVEHRVVEHRASQVRARQGRVRQIHMAQVPAVEDRVGQVGVVEYRVAEVIAAEHCVGEITAACRGQPNTEALIVAVLIIRGDVHGRDARHDRTKTLLRRLYDATDFRHLRHSSIG